MPVKVVCLCTGLLRRGDRVLLVRCTYPGEPEALWVLPGGRQENGETVAVTVVREFAEETGLRVHPESIAYVSESIDERRGWHVVNFTFEMAEEDSNAQPRPADPKVVESRFVPVAEAPALLRADVLRIPVTSALAGRPYPRYFNFPSSKIAVPFFRGPISAKDIG